MSQGELHALALAIFLPRATLPASPFRFVIIDDPVQSMDPSRIDGLARVLESVARDRQVIVFTHDPRLTDAVYRLQIPAQVVGVTRRPGSRVELHEESDASSRALADADAVTRTADLAPEVATTVVAGLCREAIEATCTQQVRRVQGGARRGRLGRPRRPGAAGPPAGRPASRPPVMAEQLLAEARALVDRRSEATRGLWPRAAALLGRRALETAITEHDPRLAGVSGRARLLCLRRTLGDPPLAEDVALAWAAPSRATHHRDDDLPPTSELDVWFDVVDRLLARTAAAT